MAMESNNITIEKDLLTAGLRKTYGDDSLTVTKVIPRRSGAALGEHSGGAALHFVDVHLENRNIPVPLFIKTSSENEGIDYENCVKEVQAFRSLFPTLAKFCRTQARNPVDLSFIPVCVYADCSPGSQVIVLEDVSSKGYNVKQVELGDNLEESYIKAVINAVATLHAVTYSFKLSTGKSLLDTFPFLQENLFSDRYKDTFGACHDKSYDICVEVLANSKECAEQYALLKSIGSNLFEESKSLLAKDGPFNVICHGDMWNANCMFRTEDNQEESIKLIDFQLPRYSHLMTDLSYYLSYSTTSAQRRSHLMQILQWYRDKFVLVAKSFDVPQIPFTTKELVQEYYALHTFWVGFAVQSIPMIVCTKEDVTNLPARNRDLFESMPSMLGNVIRREGNREKVKQGLLELCEEILWLKEAVTETD